MTLFIEFGNIRKDKSVAVYIRVEHRGTRFRVNTHINLNKSEYYYGKTGYKIRNITKHSAIEGKVNKLRNKIIEEYGEYLVTNNELDLSRLFLPKQKQSPRIPRGDKQRSRWITSCLPSMLQITRTIFMISMSSLMAGTKDAQPRERRTIRQE